MRSSALICRQREAHHLNLASETVLKNVRKVELAAAAAWGKLAHEAEVREVGSTSRLSPADTEIALEFLLEEDGILDGDDKEGTV